jgi:hypothetical protein
MLRCSMGVMRKVVSHRGFVCFLHTFGVVPTSTRFLGPATWQSDLAVSVFNSHDGWRPTHKSCSL